MKLPRLSYAQDLMVDFFREGLEHLGSICERTWYDRLEVVTEGAGARLWNTDGALHEVELCFRSADDAAPRDAVREVFPGCPLTFQLAQTFFARPVPLERAVLPVEDRGRPPATEVAEKLWLARWPGTSRWRLESPWVAAHHFSLMALVRCETQAIDQHWSLHRLAMSLSDGESDEMLATHLGFTQLAREGTDSVVWPAADPKGWHRLLINALEDELASDLDAVRSRQENYLRREIDRIDDYFETYAAELTERTARSANVKTKERTSERLAAARAEHARRRQDQVHRHEICVIPHVDALLLLAEPAWQTTVGYFGRSEPRAVPALFVPRCRRWLALGPGASTMV